MLEVTQQQILAGLRRYPCADYSPELVARLFRSHRSMLVLEALQLPTPPQDKIRALILYPDIVPDFLKHEIGCRYAEYLLSKYPHADPLVHRALNVKHGWLAGNITNWHLMRTYFECIDLANKHYPDDIRYDVYWAIAHAVKPDHIAMISAAYNTVGASVTLSTPCATNHEAEWNNLLQITTHHIADYELHRCRKEGR